MYKRVVFGEVANRHVAALADVNGREFLIQVPGTSQTSMNDADVAVMMNWMLKQFSAAEVPAGTLPYSEQEVKQLRANRLADVPGRRAAIVSELKAQGISIE